MADYLEPFLASLRLCERYRLSDNRRSKFRKDYP